MQGEERDSSDEEWAAAYSTMDTISQLGWRNRRGEVVGPAEQLMRDVFEVADEVHEAAMSEMVGSVHSGESVVHVDEPGAVAGFMSDPSDVCKQPATSVEVDQEGGCTFESFWCNVPPIWQFWYGCGAGRSNCFPPVCEAQRTEILVWWLNGIATGLMFRQRAWQHRVIRTLNLGGGGGRRERRFLGAGGRACRMGGELELVV